MCTECEKVEMGFTTEKFPRGTHMCYIYNDDEERKAIIAKFLEAGLKENEKVVYFAHEMNKAEMVDMMEGEGVKVRERDQDHFFVSKAMDTYCPKGKFELETMVEGLVNFYQGSMSEGYTGVRVSGEMAWALEHKPGTERLMEYESLGDIVLKPNPLTLICQYDARKFDGATLLNCLKVHPYMIVKGQIVQNPYYMTHEEFMEEFRKNAGS